MKPNTKLRIVKTIHTIVWAIFASSIFAIPIYAYRGNLKIAWMLVAFVFVEVVILAANQMRCPLTDIARNYTSDREDNFDIYLPLWIARYNKQLFGSLYLADIVYTLIVWMASRAAI